jgi:hypothetical protein
MNNVVLGSMNNVVLGSMNNVVLGSMNNVVLGSMNNMAFATLTNLWRKAADSVAPVAHNNTVSAHRDPVSHLTWCQW